MSDESQAERMVYPLMAFPIKKRINFKLFIDGMANLLKDQGQVKMVIGKLQK